MTKTVWSGYCKLCEVNFQPSKLEKTSQKQHFQSSQHKAAVNMKTMEIRFDLVTSIRKKAKAGACMLCSGKDLRLSSSLFLQRSHDYIRSDGVEFIHWAFKFYPTGVAALLYDTELARMKVMHHVRASTALWGMLTIVVKLQTDFFKMLICSQQHVGHFGCFSVEVYEDEYCYASELETDILEKLTVQTVDEKSCASDWQHDRLRLTVHQDTLENYTVKRQQSSKFTADYLFADPEGYIFEPVAFPQLKKSAVYKYAVNYEDIDEPLRARFGGQISFNTRSELLQARDNVNTTESTSCDRKRTTIKSAVETQHESDIMGSNIQSSAVKVEPKEDRKENGLLRCDRKAKRKKSGKKQKSHDGTTSVENAATGKPETKLGVSDSQKQLTDFPHVQATEDPQRTRTVPGKVGNDIREFDTYLTNLQSQIQSELNTLSDKIRSDFKMLHSQLESNFASLYAQLL